MPTRFISKKLAASPPGRCFIPIMEKHHVQDIPRAVLAGATAALAGGSVANLAIVASAKTVTPDPIFAAIESHRRANAAYSDASRAYGELEEAWSAKNGSLDDSYRVATAAQVRAECPELAEVTKGQDWRFSSGRGIDRMFSRVESSSYEDKADAEDTRVRLRKRLAANKRAHRAHFRAGNARLKETGEAEQTARKALCEVRPTTMAGIVALLSHAGTADDIMGDDLSQIMKSVEIALSSLFPEAVQS